MHSCNAFSLIGANYLVLRNIFLSLLSVPLSNPIFLLLINKNSINQLNLKVTKTSIDFPLSLLQNKIGVWFHEKLFVVTPSGGISVSIGLIHLLMFFSPVYASVPFLYPLFLVGIEMDHRCETDSTFSQSNISDFNFIN